MSETRTTETLDRLYLEWSQFTKAKTWKEIQLEAALAAATKRAEEAERVTQGCRDLIATQRTRIAEVEQERDEAESRVHFCPICKMYCKECECMQTKLTAAEQENARLREAISQTWKECDDARMSEVEDARKEADHWKAEGDMYGWNFHQGRAAGMITASIIYHRIERAALLAKPEGGSDD